MDIMASDKFIKHAAYMDDVHGRVTVTFTGFDETLRATYMCMYT